MKQIEQAVERLEKLKQVFDGMFWKGEKEHPEKTELLETINYAIDLATLYLSTNDKSEAGELTEGEIREVINSLVDCFNCNGEGWQYNPRWEDFYKTQPKDKYGDLEYCLNWFGVFRREDLPWEERQCPTCEGTGKLPINEEELPSKLLSIFTAKMMGLREENEELKQGILKCEHQVLLTQNQWERFIDIEEENNNLKQEIRRLKDER